MPNPSPKVAAMASIFQQQTEVDTEEKIKTVKKGRQSLPVYGESGYSKHKKALRRTNSYKDRFSNARMMFERKGSVDNLDTSRSSITSVVSNSSITHDAHKTSSRQSRSSSVSSTGEDETEPPAKVKQMADVFKITFGSVNKPAVKLSNADELNLNNKENISHSQSTEVTKSPSTAISQTQVLSPNRQFITVGQIKTDSRDCFGQNCDKSPLENTTPPPLPILPPPSLLSVEGKTAQLLAEEETLLISNLEPLLSGEQPDSLDISKRLSFCQEIPVEDSPVAEVASKSENTDTLDLELVTEDVETSVIPIAGQSRARSDGQSYLQEYSELCESPRPVEYQKVEEEFARLAELTDFGQTEYLAGNEHDDHITEDDHEDTNDEVDTVTELVVTPLDCLATDNGQMYKLSDSLDPKVQAVHKVEKSGLNPTRQFLDIEGYEVSNNSTASLLQCKPTESETVEIKSEDKLALKPNSPNKIQVQSKSETKWTYLSISSPVLADLEIKTPRPRDGLGTNADPAVSSGKFVAHEEFSSTPMSLGVGTNLHGRLDDEVENYTNVDQVSKKDDITETESETQNKYIDANINQSNTTSDAGINTSSLGSSLVGQSVSSWLGTPGSLSADSSISAAPSPKIVSESDKYDCSKYIQETEESSDYVSGDSCDLGPPSSVKAESKPVIELFNEKEVKIHYLSDGNFWVEGPPLVPTSLLDDSPTTSKHYKPPSRLRFSSSPVRLFSTYTAEEYDRKNDDIDPAAASAEYELEKRVEKMEMFDVNLIKGDDGLGLSILGMGVGVDTGVEKLGIFIKTITSGGVAEVDGRIQVNDQIISVDGSCLVGVTQAFAASVLRNTSGQVQFVVGRDKDPGDSEVAQLIRQSVEADLDRDDQDQSVEENESSLATSSSMEGEQLFNYELEKQDTSGDEEEFNVSPLPEDNHSSVGKLMDQFKESTNNVADCTHGDQEQPDISSDESGQCHKTTWQKPDENCFMTGGEEITDSCTPAVIPLIANKKLVSEDDAPVDEADNCCSHQESYKMLLAKYQQSQETISQMKGNMSIVTEQLVSRDQLFSTHMTRLREVFMKLEEQLNDTKQVAACQQSLINALEPRGALRRRPYIPSNTGTSADNDYPPSVLDQAIPPTPLLDTTLARDRVSLVHRGTLARRKGRGRQNTNTEDAGGVCATSHVNTSPVGKSGQKEVAMATFQEELRKTLLNNRRNTMTERQVETIPTTPPPPVSTCRASSLPSSPSISQYSSSSSLQSVPGNLDGPPEMKREKKRMSGKSLLKLARRRLSSR